MNKKLKLCPFCGGEAGIRTIGELAYIECSVCHCQTEGVYYKQKEEAISKWNSRPSPWHTGTPTEEGKYLVKYRTGFMEFLSYRDGKWFAKETIETMWGERLKSKRIDVTELVLEWQKIEP